MLRPAARQVARSAPRVSAPSRSFCTQHRVTGAWALKELSAVALILACGTGAVYAWQRVKPDAGEAIRRHVQNAEDARQSGRYGQAVFETNAALTLLRRVLKEKVGAADEAELRALEADFTSQLSEFLLHSGHRPQVPAPRGLTTENSRSPDSPSSGRLPAVRCRAASGILVVAQAQAAAEQAIAIMASIRSTRAPASQPRSAATAISERAALRVASVFDAMAQQSQDSGARDVALQLYSRAVQLVLDASGTDSKLLLLAMSERRPHGLRAELAAVLAGLLYNTGTVHVEAAEWEEAAWAMAFAAFLTRDPRQRQKCTDTIAWIRKQADDQQTAARHSG